MTLPDSWGEWKPVPPNYFVDEQYDAEKHSRKASAENYTLEPCEVNTTVSVENPQRFGNPTAPRFIVKPVTYRARLTFEDGSTYLFVSDDIAKVALPELLTRRKAKHPTPPAITKPGNGEGGLVFFTSRRLQQIA